MTICSLYLIAFTLTGNGPFWVPVEQGTALADAVIEIESARQGRSTDFALLEQRVSELLDQFPLPNDRGVLYFYLVNAYAQSGMQRRDVMLKHVNSALELLQEPSRRWALHTIAGDAHRLGIDGPPSPDSRLSAAKFYLSGLKECASQELSVIALNELRAAKIRLSNKKIELELGESFLMDERYVSELSEDAKDRLEADVSRLRSEVDELEGMSRGNELSRLQQFHSNVLRKQLASLVRRRPNELESVKVLCNEVLGEANACEEIFMIKPDRKHQKADDMAPFPKGNGTNFIFIVVLNVVSALAVLLLILIKRKTRQK